MLLHEYTRLTSARRPTRSEILAGDDSPVTSASLGLNDEAIATTSSDGLTRVWAGPVPRPAKTVPDAGLPPGAVNYNASGTIVLDLSTVLGVVLDARTLHVLADFRAPEGQHFVYGSLSPGGTDLYVGAGPCSITAAQPRCDTTDQLI
jgi:hypothetical protein